MQTHTRSPRVLGIALGILLIGLLAAPTRCLRATADAGSEGAGRRDPSGRVVIFVLDSPIDARFLEGRVLGLKGEDITHGSLVGRVIRSYCRAEVVSVPVTDGSGAISRERYVGGLRGVLHHIRSHPGDRVLVNISLGSPDADPAEQALIGGLIEGGALVVAAAGNDNSEQPFYPASYKGVVAVAAATESGKAPGSNFGPHVAISASGDISFIDYEFLPFERLRREMEARGTSFAAPKVTATVAYILQRRPQMTAPQALAMLHDTSEAINDRYFVDWKLGSGLLNVYEAKARVTPLYRFLHYGLPMAVCILLGALTVFLCVRYALIGVFVSLLVWLVGLPTGILIVLETWAYLEFVGAGSLLTGLKASALMAAAGVVGGLVLHGNPPKMVLAAAPAGALLVLLMGGELVGPMPASVLVGCTAVACSMAIEWRTRALLRRIRMMPDGEPHGQVASFLARVCERAVDSRVRRAAERAILQLPPSEAAALLEGVRANPHGAAALLAVVQEHLDREEAQATRRCAPEAEPPA